MNKYFEELRPYLDKNMALEAALGLLSWDTETLAPKEATEQTAKVVGILSMEAYNAIVNDDVRGLVKKLDGEKKNLTSIELGILKQLEKMFEQLESIPAEEYRRYSELVPVSTAKWIEAKKENDYGKFLPVLTEIIEYTKKFAGYRKKEGETLYDVILGDFEEGFTSKKLDEFFAKIKEEIPPVVEKIKEKPKAEYGFLFQKYDIEKQKEYSKFLAEYLGYDFNKGIIAESEHPFTGGLHNKDVRITTHYYEDNVESAMLSTIHEVGHGLYEMNIPDELTQTLVGTGSSMGLHESQSRFIENIVGRNKAFWEPIYEKLQKKFPENLGEIDLDQFMHGINRSMPGLIRTEADELTYSIHIMIRYEIEKKIFNEDYPVEKLPELWDELYETFLGVRAKSLKEGILQDIHWAQGSFGYFPSYALGSAVASQLVHQMKKEMDFEGLLRAGDIKTIVAWLKDKVHQYGKLKNTDEVLLEATGEEFNAEYYVSYLKEKFVKEYEL